MPADAHERPRQPGKVRSVILAIAVHAAFFALIVFGVSWQSSPTPPLQAELWDKLPTGKTTPAPKAAPEPEPEPVKTEPAPEPPKPEPEPAPPKADPEPEPPRPDPAIAEKKEREKKERERKEREKKEQEKRDQERKESERKEEERKQREAKAAAEAKATAARAAAAKAAADAKAKKEKDDAEALAQVAAQARISEIDGFRGRIRDKIRGRANVPDTVRGKPEVQVRITILPGGEVLEARVVRASGNRVYDDAILRAIRSASPLPVPPANSELFPTFRDLILNFEHER